METTNRQTSSITSEMIDEYRQLLSLRRDDMDRVDIATDEWGDVIYGYDQADE